MAAHARLKNEFMEDEKYYNLMSWLIYVTLHELVTVSSENLIIFLTLEPADGYVIK